MARSIQDGYVHVMLRQLPPTSDTPAGKVRVELSVLDTGKVRNPVAIGALTAAERVSRL